MLNSKTLTKKFIGQRIKEQRKRAGLTQFELAEKVGLHEKQISRIESGINYPTFENFMKIINILDLSLSDFEHQNDNELSFVKNDIIYILNSSTKKELELYRDLLETLRKNL